MFWPIFKTVWETFYIRTGKLTCPNGYENAFTPGNLGGEMSNFQA